MASQPGQNISKIPGFSHRVAQFGTVWMRRDPFALHSPKADERIARRGCHDSVEPQFTAALSMTDSLREEFHPVNRITATRVGGTRSAPLHADYVDNLPVI